jgi:hypothetical protein
LVRKASTLALNAISKFGYWILTVDSFIVLSEQDIGIGDGQAATLTLANGAARHVLEGKFERDGAGVGRPAFASEIDADGKTLQQIRVKLLPVLEGKGPIVLSVGSISRSCRWPDWLNL